MTINKANEKKYTWLVVTSILVAIAVVDKIPLLYRLFGKFDITLILTILALVFQVYSFYQAAATDAVEDMRTDLLKVIKETEDRLRGLAREQVERYDRSLSGLDLRVNTRSDAADKRLDYLDQGQRQLSLAQKAHEQTPGHVTSVKRWDELFYAVTVIKAKLEVLGGKVTDAVDE